jgi:hypothetical protein
MRCRALGINSYQNLSNVQHAVCEGLQYLDLGRSLVTLPCGLSLRGFAVCRSSTLRRSRGGMT